MQLSVPPPVHEYELNPAETHNCSAPLLHFVEGPVIETKGEVKIVNAFESVAVHPFAAVTVTE